MTEADPPRHTPHSTKCPGTPLSIALRQIRQSERQRFAVVIVAGRARKSVLASASEGKPEIHHTHRLFRRRSRKRIEGWAKWKSRKGISQRVELVKRLTGKEKAQMRWLHEWLKRHRLSSRAAFLLQVSTKVLSAGASLFWARLLLDAMGEEQYGLFVAFTACVALFGLGDIGLCGAVGIKLGQMLGRADRSGADTLLANARGLLLVLIGIVVAAGVGLAAWLPGWLGFQETARTGSLAVLFQCGFLGFALGVSSSYLASICYGTGFITWPIIPIFISGQVSLFLHWYLARSGHFLWLQYTAYLIGVLLNLFVYWMCIRASHPEFARILPVRLRSKGWGELLKDGLWFYVWTVSCVIYTSADRLFVNAGFGASAVPQYHLNYKACELAMWLIATAALVAMPKLTQLLASPERAAEGIQLASRLQTGQAAAAIIAGVGYLFLNDWFMSVWIGPGSAAPHALQIVFAANLAVTASGDSSSQITIRSGRSGLKIGGVTVLLSAILNIGLSFVAMVCGSMLGIALATVIAQLFLAIVLSRYAAGVLGLDKRGWVTRVAIIPVGAVVAVGIIRASVRSYSDYGNWFAIAASGIIVILALKFVGVNKSFFKMEWAAFSGLFRRESSREV